ncbi:hypothetical protein PENSPDRAFT_153408 [Peniophora sp. CONT]|nr:hypothetical protein PENSPDRAFT_153408 [Peniophora sp. CONT]
MHFKTPFSIDRSSTPRPTPTADTTPAAMPSILEHVPGMSRSTSQTRTIVAPVTPTRKTFRRRRSMLERWLDDQRESDDELEHQYEPQAPVRATSPYVGSPDRGAGASASSFVLVASEEDREMGSEVYEYDPSSRRSFLSSAMASSSSPGSTRPRTYSPFKFSRPSVLSTFTPAKSPSSLSPYTYEHNATPESSRPSFTSTRTASSSNTMTSSDASTSRPSSSARFKAPSPSLWSLPMDASHARDAPEAERTLAAGHRTSTHTLRGFMAPLSRPKRRLVVSGIGPGETQRTERLYQWACRFGEVREMVRAPNGRDLLIDFRRAEVADTVCRLNARVFIPDVGSVALSYTDTARRR